MQHSPADVRAAPGDLGVRRLSSPVRSPEGPKPPPGWSGVAVCNGRPPEDRFDIKSTSAPTRGGLRHTMKVQGRARVKEEGKLLASIAVCLTEITPRLFECQQTPRPSRISRITISASAPAPATPFPSQIPSERASGGQRSSHPAHYQGNRHGPRPTSILSPNDRRPDTAHYAPITK